VRSGHYVVYDGHGRVLVRGNEGGAGQRCVVAFPHGVSGYPVESTYYQGNWFFVLGRWFYVSYWMCRGHNLASLMYIS
jgi:hypothetical protein